MRYSAVLPSAALAFALVAVGRAGQFPSATDSALTRGAIIGDELTHVVGNGETLRKLAAWYGVDPAVIAAENGLSPGAAVKPGQPCS